MNNRFSIYTLLYILLLTGITLFFCTGLRAQEWRVYDTINSKLPDNQVQAVAIDKNNITWVGTTKGLARFDGAGWTVYTPANSPLPSSFIYSLATDKAGRVWIGTDKGMAMLDGSRWTVYNRHNSVFTYEGVNKILYDENSNTLWISNERVLVQFDGSRWTRYDSSNSYIFESFVIHSLAVDKNGHLWVGAFDIYLFNGRLVTFDGRDWSIDKLDNHGLFSSFPYALTVDAQNNVWMGTGGTTGGVLVRIKNGQWDVLDQSVSPFIHGAFSLAAKDSLLWAGGRGLTRYNEKEWMGFTTKNSVLPDDYVSALALDKNGNVWIGTISGGLAVYNTHTPNPVPASPAVGNFPNPFAQTTTIVYEIPVAGKVQAAIFNAAGQWVANLQDEQRPAGKHTLPWRAGGLPAGVYYCHILFNNTRSVHPLLLLR